MLTRTSIKRTEKFEASLGVPPLRCPRKRSPVKSILNLVKAYQKAEDNWEDYWDSSDDACNLDFDKVSALTEIQTDKATKLAKALARALDNGLITIQETIPPVAHDRVDCPECKCRHTYCIECGNCQSCGLQR